MIAGETSRACAARASTRAAGSTTRTSPRRPRSGARRLPLRRRTRRGGKRAAPSAEFVPPCPNLPRIEFCFFLGVRRVDGRIDLALLSARNSALSQHTTSSFIHSTTSNYPQRRAARTAFPAKNRVRAQSARGAKSVEHKLLAPRRQSARAHSRDASRRERGKKLSLIHI